MKKLRCCGAEEVALSLHEDLFFLRSPGFGWKNCLNLGEDLFLGITCFCVFGRKTASIKFKTDGNLGQVRLLMFQASKKAPPPFAQSWLRYCLYG